VGDADPYASPNWQQFWSEKANYPIRYVNLETATNRAVEAHLYSLIIGYLKEVRGLAEWMELCMHYFYNWGMFQSLYLI
jgi:hypothetical protein